MSKPLYRLVETSAPAVEPVTLAEAKAHLRVDQVSDDGLIADLIKAARQACEAFTGRAFIARDISLYLDRWPGGKGEEWWEGLREGAFLSGYAGEVRLPRPPLFTVTDLRVYDANGVATPFLSSGYFVDATGVSGRIVLKDGIPPPSPGRVANGIEVRYTAGYGTAASALPAPLREAVKQVTARFYDNRGDEAGSAPLPFAAQGLLQPYRVLDLP